MMNREKKEVTEIAFTDFLNLIKFPADNRPDFKKYLGFCFPKIRVLKWL